jgi:ABC-type sugar transport system ATPase subunit
MSGDVQVPVLRGLSLDIYPGELTLVSGPSGCGKSTLLSLLSGLSAPDGGRVHALGQDVGHMTRSEVERFRLHHVGFVFQGFNLFPALTALEQVQLPLGYRGMRNRESDRWRARRWKKWASATAATCARRSCPAARSSVAVCLRQVADADLRRRTHQRAGRRERPARDRHPASLRTCAWRHRAVREPRSAPDPACRSGDRHGRRHGP